MEGDESHEPTEANDGHPVVEQSGESSPKPSQPFQYPFPSPFLENGKFAPVRTPKKGGSETDGELLDECLAWTLGGEMSKTAQLGSPWGATLPSGSPHGDDELEALEQQIKHLELLDGTS